MPSISTERLALRPFAADDLAVFAAYRRDPEVARYQSWSPDYSEADGRAFITAVSGTPFAAPGQWVNLAVTLRTTSELIGDVALRVEPDGSAGQLGFTFATAHQRRGYAREAVGALLELARAAGVRAFFAITDARNTGSIGLLRALGFREIGFHARDASFKGELCDELRFELSECSEALS